MTDFERRVHMSGAYDRRHSDPNKNFGIHGMEIRFALIGELGAVQFLVFTGLHLPHVQDELWNSRANHNPFSPMGADIGYHSRRPMYEDQEPAADECEYIGGPCYYDGSGLQASEFMPEFLAGGSEAVWRMLESRYYEIFSDSDAN